MQCARRRRPLNRLGPARHSLPPTLISRQPVLLTHSSVHPGMLAYWKHREHRCSRTARADNLPRHPSPDRNHRENVPRPGAAIHDPLRPRERDNQLRRLAKRASCFDAVGKPVRSVASMVTPSSGGSLYHPVKELFHTFTEKNSLRNVVRSIFLHQPR